MARRNKREVTLSLTELKSLNIINREDHLSTDAIKVVENRTDTRCKRFVKRDRDNGVLIVETIDGLKAGVPREQLLKSFNNKQFAVSDRLLHKITNA